MLRSAVFILSFLVVACSAPSSSNSPSGSGDNDGLTFSEKIQAQMDKMTMVGVTLTLGGQVIADLASVTPTVSTYGTVTQGTTLNYLTDGELDFIVYGNDGVFAAECETSVTEPTFGPTHPLCQTYGAENYDRLIVCFANSEGADIAVAQNWPGTAVAFEAGRGLICYVNGTKMLSTHVFTY